MQRVTADTDVSTLDSILASARDLFRRQGVRRTRMGEIAEGAGVVRQTLYDWVGSRGDLVDLAMAARVAELGEVVKSRPVEPHLDIRDQIVEVVAEMAVLSATDEEAEILAQGMTEDHAFAFMSGPSPLTDVVVDILGPYFARAQEAGILRDELGVRAMAEWAQLILAPLRYRSDLSPDDLRARLRHFLLPALVESPR